MEEKTLFTSRPNLSSVPVLGDLGCEKQQVLMKHSLSWAAQEFATTLGFWIWNLFNLQQLGFADLGAVDGIGGVHFCLEPFVSDLACALLLLYARAQLASLIMNLIMLVIIFLVEVTWCEENFATWLENAWLRDTIFEHLHSFMVWFVIWLKQAMSESEVLLAMFKITTPYIPIYHTRRPELI